MGLPANRCYPDWLCGPNFLPWTYPLPGAIQELIVGLEAWGGLSNAVIQRAAPLTSAQNSVIRRPSYMLCMDMQAPRRQVGVTWVT